jgi:hypothetical protein
MITKITRRGFLGCTAVGALLSRISLRSSILSLTGMRVRRQDRVHIGPKVMVLRLSDGRVIDASNPFYSEERMTIKAACPIELYADEFTPWANLTTIELYPGDSLEVHFNYETV